MSTPPNPAQPKVCRLVGHCPCICLFSRRRSLGAELKRRSLQSQVCPTVPSLSRSGPIDGMDGGAHPPIHTRCSVSHCLSLSLYLCTSARLRPPLIPQHASGQEGPCIYHALVASVADTWTHHIPPTLVHWSNLACPVDLGKKPTCAHGHGVTKRVSLGVIGCHGSVLESSGGHKAHK